jgi:hypothetical protein
VSSSYSSRMLAVVFEVRRQISTELVVEFGLQPSYLRSVGRLGWSLLIGRSSIGVSAWCLSVCVVYRLSLSRCIRYP